MQNPIFPPDSSGQPLTYEAAERHFVTLPVVEQDRIIALLRALIAEIEGVRHG